MRSDETLWLQYLNGPEGAGRIAFKELAERHYRKGFHYCFLILGDTDDACDAVQTTWRKILELKKPYEKFERVLFAALHNATFDILRSRKRHPIDRIDLADPLDSHLSVYLPDESIDAETIIATLTPDERELVHLYIYQGLKWKEISEITNQRIGTLESKWSRLLKRIRITFFANQFEKEST